MLLEVKNLNAGYGFLQILRDVSLTVDTGEYVCMVGPNGAGKSTTLKTIAGLVAPMSGEILFKGEPIDGLPGNQVARKGIAFVSEEMNLFVNMTVQENLAMGAYTIRDKKMQKDRLEFVYDLFPRLDERRSQLAGTMSGGERKMLAIGRGLMSNPTLLLVDEPSFGLAPLLTESVFQSLDTLGQARRDHHAGGAERDQGPGGDRPGLRSGKRPHRAVRQEQRPGLRRPCTQGLFRGLIRKGYGSWLNR